MPPTHATSPLHMPSIPPTHATSPLHPHASSPTPGHAPSRQPYTNEELLEQVRAAGAVTYRMKQCLVDAVNTAIPKAINAALPALVGQLLPHVLEAAIPGIVERVMPAILEKVIITVQAAVQKEVANASCAAQFGPNCDEDSNSEEVFMQTPLSMDPVRARASLHGVSRAAVVSTADVAERVGEVEPLTPAFEALMEVAGTELVGSSAPRIPVPTDTAAPPAHCDLAHMEAPLPLLHKGGRLRKPSASCITPYQLTKHEQDYKHFMGAKGRTRAIDGYPTHLDRKYFELIENTTVPLELSVLQLYARILAQRLWLGTNISPLLSYKSINIVDACFFTELRMEWEQLCSDNPEIKDDYPSPPNRFPTWHPPDELIAYVKCNNPPSYVETWHEVPELFLLCLVGPQLGGHWVTCRVSLLQREIYIYDSLVHQVADNPVHRQTQLAPLSRLLPRLLDDARFYEKTNTAPDFQPFRFITPSGHDQFMQNGGQNCGAYALLYIERAISRTLTRKRITEEAINAYSY